MKEQPYLLVEVEISQHPLFPHIHSEEHFYKLFNRRTKFYFMSTYVNELLDQRFTVFLN